MMSGAGIIQERRESRRRRHWRRAAVFACGRDRRIAVASDVNGVGFDTIIRGVGA